MNGLKEISSLRSFEGLQKIFTHYSVNLKSSHEFSVYLPPKAIIGQRCPVLYWCSGAASDEREFILKSGFQKYASECNMIVVAPEPNPAPIKIKEKDNFIEYFAQFGFYLNATEPPYKENFQMYSYFMEELVPLIDYKFPVISDKRGVAGHSMGGMGALVFGLRNTEIFKSISVMSAISNVSGTPEGRLLKKMFFGDNEEEAVKYDPSLLAESYKGPLRHILFDEGGADELWHLISAPAFIERIKFKNLSLTYRIHQGYSHGMEMVATFIEDHIIHHAKELNWSIGVPI